MSNIQNLISQIFSLWKNLLIDNIACDEDIKFYL